MPKVLEQPQMEETVSEETVSEEVKLNRELYSILSDPDRDQLRKDIDSRELLKNNEFDYTIGLGKRIMELLNNGEAEEAKELVDNFTYLIDKGQLIRDVFRKQLEQVSEENSKQAKLLIDSLGEGVEFGEIVEDVHKLQLLQGAHNYNLTSDLMPAAKAAKHKFSHREFEVEWLLRKVAHNDEWVQEKIHDPNIRSKIQKRLDRLTKLFSARGQQGRISVLDEAKRILKEIDEKE